jgi:ketosteroid isomerase-like protein
VAQANVELLENMINGARTLDKDALLANLPAFIAEFCDPEIEWVEDRSRADARVFRGHEGVRESWERWLEGFDAYGFEVEAIEDHGDRVLVTAVEHGRGRASGADVSARIYILCTFRAGKVLRYEEFYAQQAARAAVES